MAHVTPPLHSLRPASAGAYTERQVLQSLCDGLDERFHLFHGVDWALAAGAADQHGELDIVVVNAAGDVALLEVKAGAVQGGDQGLSKRYGALDKDLAAQAKRQFSGVLHRLKQEGLGARLLHLLVLPDQRVDEAGTVSYPRDRIADAGDCADLPAYLMARLGSGLPDPALQARVLAFFANRLGWQPDVSASADRLRQQVQWQSQGLATWVPRIQAPEGLLRVQGTAGSGKTQLALRLLRDAVVARQRAAYVCFNRPLADQMRRHAPDAVAVASFHQWAWQAAGSPLGVPDHAAHVQALAQAVQDRPGELDLLVIDELQDFTAEWVALMVAHLAPSGRLVMLDDPGQCLYADREEIELPGTVLVSSHDNHRSPRQVVAVLNALRLGDQPIQALSPLAGSAPAWQVYQPGASAQQAGSLQRQTQAAVQACLDAGFALADVALLSWRGRERSSLLKLDRLGDWPLSKFNGQYDAAGEPLWTDGALRLDTVRRFKGQSAPAVVVTEVDFDTLDTLSRRLLFVALTRAQMQVACVLSPAAEQTLAARLG